MKFATIVADPPWRVRAKRIGLDHLARATAMPYDTMAIDQLAELPVAELAADSSVLYLWAVQSMLREAYSVAEAWGYRVVNVLVWSKPAKGVTRADYVCSAEFVLYAKRGTPARKTQQMGTVFAWPRRGGHSAKPEAFLDLVEQVNPGPYLELFARRARLGWERWGDEVDSTVELAA